MCKCERAANGGREVRKGGVGSGRGGARQWCSGGKLERGRIW